MPSFLRQLWGDRRLRYIVVGFAILGTNLAVAKIAFSFDFFLASALRRNLGNVLVTEIAVVTAFFLHRRFTWESTEKKLVVPLLRFHAVTGVGLIGRLAVFAGLDALGVSPMLATLGSIPAAIIVNYFGYDRLVFRRKKRRAEEAQANVSA